MPTDAQLEKSLRDAVRAYHTTPDGEATVKTMRTKSEQSLGLAEGFYKNDDVWKEKSKQIIQDQFDVCEAGEEQEKTQATEEKRKSLKRASPAVQSKSRKKSKIEQEDDESTALSEPPEASEDEDLLEDDAPPKKSVKKQTMKKSSDIKNSKPPTMSKTNNRSNSDSDLPDAPSDNEESSAKKEDLEADDSSSELSSVIDEPIPVKRSSKSAPKAKSTKSSVKSKAKPSTESDPKAEEIKRLQGWLVKCGIRKVWGKELKPFETQNAKISHLKSMLSDAGMTGRYSNEKAAQIKEARELAADIEAVQEGNERWGKDGEEDQEEDQGRGGGRRLVRGAKNYAFLSSDGEEESD